MKPKKTNSYLRAQEKAVRTKTADLTKKQEEAILKAYTDAGQTLVDKLKTTKGKMSNSMYRDYAYTLHEKIVQIQSKYTQAAALNPLQKEVLVTLELLGEKGTTESVYGRALNKVINIYSEKAVEALIRGEIYKDGKGLSARIWRNSSMASNAVQEIAAQGLSSGMSAVDMANLLEPHVIGSSKRIWQEKKIEEKLGKVYANMYKNLEYNALRLARTTISHAATTGMKEASKVNPLFKKLQWHSVHAPGRTCQICKDLDLNVYSVEECPYDHPNGLCYQTHYFEESMDEMAERLRGWVDNPSSDSELENWWAQTNQALQ